MVCLLYGKYIFLLCIFLNICKHRRWNIIPNLRGRKLNMIFISMSCARKVYEPSKAYKLMIVLCHTCPFSSRCLYMRVFSLGKNMCVKYLSILYVIPYLQPFGSVCFFFRVYVCTTWKMKEKIKIRSQKEKKHSKKTVCWWCMV